MTPALSDGDVGDFRPLLAQAGDVLDRPDLRWAATGGRDGTAPRERIGVFPIGGYCTLRSGWGDGARAYADERWGVFDCGPIGDGGHGHYDQLAVELWADGHAARGRRRRYTYADGDDGWRHWFKGTAAHNTVCVDGLDQGPYRPGKPKGPLSTARLVHRVADGGVDMVVGTAVEPALRRRPHAGPGAGRRRPLGRPRPAARRARARLRRPLAPGAGGQRHRRGRPARRRPRRGGAAACGSSSLAGAARCPSRTVDLADVRGQAAGAGRRRAYQGLRRRVVTRIEAAP